MALVLALPRRREAALPDEAGVAGLPALRRHRDPAEDRVGPMNHPAWCARGHRCDPDLGVHRSESWTIRTAYGRIVATRVRQSGRDRLEVRTVVDLPRGDEVAVSRLVLLAIDLAVRDGLARRLAKLRARYERLRRPAA